jgi:hypothetical protein
MHDLYAQEARVMEAKCRRFEVVGAGRVLVLIARLVGMRQ